MGHNLVTEKQQQHDNIILQKLVRPRSYSVINKKVSVSGVFYK